VKYKDAIEDLVSRWLLAGARARKGKQAPSFDDLQQAQSFLTQALINHSSNSVVATDRHPTNAVIHFRAVCHR